MSNVAVVADSVICLPSETIKAYGIRIAPCCLTIDGKGYLDEVDISADEFWQKFPNIKQVSTSGALPDEFVRIFKELAQETDEIVCITLSKALSVSYKSAIQARALIQEDYPGLKIEVIDSKLVIGAEGFIVREAARAACEGKGLEEVCRVARSMIERAKWVVGLQTAHTAKFGRASGAVFSGNNVEIIPLIAQLHATGIVEKAGSTCGKPASFQRMVEIVGENIDAQKPLHVIVHYTDNIEDGRHLLEMVKAKYQCAEACMTPYSPVLGGSSGPATAIAFYV